MLGREETERAKRQDFMVKGSQDQCPPHFLLLRSTDTYIHMYIHTYICSRCIKSFAVLEANAVLNEVCASTQTPFEYLMDFD
jgi:hypothetical protein